MDICSFQSGFLRRNCLRYAFLLVLLQPLVAVPLRGLVYNRPPVLKTDVRPRKPHAAVPKVPKIPLDDMLYDRYFLYENKENPKRQLKLTADIAISVHAKYEGEVVEKRIFFEDGFERTAGTYNKGSAVVYFKLPPADAIFKITFDPLKPSLASSNQQRIFPEFMFRTDTMFPDLEGANGHACFEGPEGTVADSLDVMVYEQIPCDDDEPPVSKYQYSVTVEFNTLRMEERAKTGKKSLRASDDKQAARGSVGVAIGVVLAVVAVVAVAAAVGLVVRRRVNAAKASCEKTSLVNLTLS